MQTGEETQVIEAACLADEECGLVAAAKAGDRDALSKLLLRCTDELRTRLAGKIGRPYRSVLDVSDVVQVTLLEAYLRISQFKYKGDGSFLAWLTRSAENNLFDAVRALDREKRRPPRYATKGGNEEESWTTLLANLAKASSTPSRALSRKEAMEVLGVAIPKLPKSYRDVVELYDLRGMSGDEVGKLLGKSRAAVFMLSARAKDHLSELLGDASRFFSSRG